MTSGKISRRWMFAMAAGLSNRIAWSKSFNRADAPEDSIDRNLHLAGSATISAPPAGNLAGAPSAAFFPRTPLETSKGVIPSNLNYGPGNPRRYGAVGIGWKHDDTAALAQCIDCNNSVVFNQGDIYGVTSITFPAGGPDVVDFNGAFIVGIATVKTDCIVAIQCSHTTFYGYQVFGLGNGSTIPNPNPNYACATWWYNGVSGSQFNTFFGMLHSTCARAVVYGALPGLAPTGGVQSENSIYGFRTVGCSNPFYSNAKAGFIHFSEPMFYVGFESWTVSRRSNARAIENYRGSIFAQGGELQYAVTAEGFAADLQACILQGMNLETAPPIQIIGDGVQIIGGSIYNTSSTTSGFTIAQGVTGTLSITGASLARGSGAGAFSHKPMVDAGAAAPSFRTVLLETTSTDWGWLLVGQRCRLVSGGRVSFRGHRLRITAADPNVYVLNTDPIISVLAAPYFDNLGYTTTGWTLSSDSKRGDTLLNTTAAGPPDYLPSQLTVTSLGMAQALSGNPTNLTTVQSTCLRVRPGELYWPTCWIKNFSAKAVGLVANFYTLDGKFASDLVAADIASIGNGVWSFVEGPVLVPDRAAYAAFGVRVISGSASITDMRISRAD